MTLRWGLLGTSFISETMAEAIALSAGSSVVAVQGRDRQRLAEFGRRHAIPACHETLEALIADPAVDIVYVGLPNHLHAEATIAAARAGKAVLCEKSLTTTMKEADALVAAIRAAGTFFVEGLMYRAHPVISHALELLTEGRIGHVKSINALYAADIARFVNPHGKGVLYDLGCYPASLLQLVMDRMSGAGAFSRHEIRAFGTRDVDSGNLVDAVAAVKFENGVLATLSTSETHGMVHEFTVTGDHASLRFRTNPWLPVAGDNIIEIISHETGAVQEAIVVHDDNDAFYHQVRKVEDAMAAGEKEAQPPSPSLRESHEIMAFLTEWESRAMCSQ